MRIIHGVVASPGIAIGTVLMLNQSPLPNTLRRVKDTEAEYQRVLSAVEIAKNQLHDLYEKALSEVNEETAVIFQIHASMIEDAEYLKCIHHILHSQSCNAEYAIEAAGKKYISEFNKTTDEYLRERAVDIEDISGRLIQILKEEDSIVPWDSCGPIIIAADHLMPSQTFQLDRSRILSFLSRRGSINGHASILARSLAVPSIIALEDGFHQIKTGDQLIVDAQAGLVIQNPDDATVIAYEEKIKELREEKLRLKALIGQKAITKDGCALEVYANLGQYDECEEVLSMDADGVGLFRSEYLFLESKTFPTEEVQFQAYKTVLENLSPKRVVIRTLDIGSDKQLSYFPIEEEDNPALGYRGIRICLDRTELFITQLRALLRASVHGRLAILFPMITEISEIKKAKELLEQVKEALGSQGISYSNQIELGIMIETPAAVMIADQLATEVDFFSIGTNDLTQYTFACDRMNTKINHLFDPGSTAILRMLKRTTDEAHAKGVRVSICGESAARADLIPYYIAMGIDELSVATPEILKVKEVICNLDKVTCLRTIPQGLF